MKQLSFVLAFIAFLNFGQETMATENLAEQSLENEASLEGDEKAIEAHILFAARSIGNTSRTRLIMDFDRPVSYKTSLLDNPKRIILDFPKVFFKLPDAESNLQQGLIKTFRYGAFGANSSRIILNLQASALIVEAQAQTLEGDNRFRIILDMESVEDQKFQEELALQPPQATQSDGSRIGEGKAKNEELDRFSEFSKDKREDILIILDPGHGGIDSGAKGKDIANNAVVEKNITLNFAKILQQKLNQLTGVKVLLTRKSDEFISLSNRVAFAQANQADLFISIHADSLREHYIRGASIYTLSKKASDELAERLAHGENQVDEIAGERPANIAAVSGILSDLIARETKLFSHNFARIVLTQFKGKIKLIKNPLRSAGFHVLKAHGVPSILLELGYLSNREDEKLLIDPKWQAKVADYLVGAIELHLQKAKTLP